MQHIKTVNEFSQHAAAEFIRTAVVIDDKIFDRKGSHFSEPKTLETPKGISPVKYKSESLEKNLMRNDDSDVFSWKQLITSFAKKHIVCSLYEPDKQDKYSSDSDVYKLCIASDIVVIDWNLHGDMGNKAIELITSLVTESLKDIPEQLRLILVYTSELDLASIAESINEALESKLGNNGLLQTENNGLAMYSSNSRIVVIGKSVNRSQYKSHEVPENALAQRSIEEFAKLASGLLQGAVLLGLAKIRENNRKILSKFDKSLDPAFLVHRAMSLPHEEACEHVHPLLGTELHSILHDCLNGQIISNDVIKNWVSERWKPTELVHDLFSSEEDSGEFITGFFLNDQTIKNKYSSDKKSGSFVKKVIKDDKECIRKLSKLIESDSSLQSSHKLAMLMSHRTPYGKIEKSLTLGTIIRKGTIDNPQYLLCLLPICDTVRLSEKRRFVFCVLDVMNEGHSTNQKANHIIEDTNGFRELLYTPKSYNCVTLDFEPNSKSNSVIATKDKEKTLSFICKTDKKRYKWIAQLKPEHAQRAAEQFSSNLSRVGLTESEWLRLMSK